MTERNGQEAKRLYRVWHPVHGEVNVEASSPYWALVEAAKDWGLRWTTIARDCIITELGPATAMKRKEKGKHAKADKKKSRYL